MMRRHLAVRAVCWAILWVGPLAAVARAADPTRAAAPALISQPAYPPRPMTDFGAGLAAAGPPLFTPGSAFAPQMASTGPPPSFAAVVNLPAVASAAPPPDPAPARWGDYAAPIEPPIALPTLTYTLAAPPHGLIQPSTGLDYRRPVTDPDSVPPDDARLSTAIDLLRPDGIAPAGVVGDHTLLAGHALISYRYQGSFFDHNYVGSHQVSDASVQAAYAFVPSHMTSNRHLLLFEYAPTDNFTWLVRAPFYNNNIAYTQAGSPSYSSAFTNPGDVSLTGLYAFFRRPGAQLHASFGLSAPTGFLDYQNVTPSPTLPNLPYDLRTSSGTFDLLPGLTYRGQSQFWTWGAQSSGVIHTGLNRLGYRLGSQADLTGWVGRRLGTRWSVSGRLDAQFWGNVYRGDSRLDAALAPTNDPGAQGGQRLNGLIGCNYFLPGDRIMGQYISVEAGLPIYQRLSGPQLGLDWIINANWNVAF